MTNDQNPAASNDVDLLIQENAALRQQLLRANTNAEEFRASTYELLNEVFPYVRPTDEELQELVHGPRGRSPFEVLEENDAKYLRGES